MDEQAVNVRTLTVVRPLNGEHEYVIPGLGDASAFLTLFYRSRQNIQSIIALHDHEPSNAFTMILVNEIKGEIKLLTVFLGYDGYTINEAGTEDPQSADEVLSKYLSDSWKIFHTLPLPSDGRSRFAVILA